MKVFKAILWTTFFWILVVLGLWIASFFYAEELSVAVPSKIKEVIISHAELDCSGAADVQEVQGAVVQETEEVETTASEDIAGLETRVATLESDYVSLVQQLNDIFATPALQALLSTPVQEEVSDEVVDEEPEEVPADVLSLE